MKWLDWRYDAILLIFLGCLVKQCIFGNPSWPLPLCVCLMAILRETRNLIPKQRDMGAEQYSNLHQRIDMLDDKVSQIALANGLRPKGRTDA